MYTPTETVGQVRGGAEQMLLVQRPYRQLDAVVQAVPIAPPVLGPVFEAVAL